MQNSLIPKSEFIGLEGKTNLAAGGETPILKSHQDAIDQFFRDKAQGEEARYLEADTANRARALCGQLLSVNPDNITFLSNASEGINNIAYGLEWKAGDNVVVCDVEFPSGLLPWTRLEAQGVEIRIVKNRNWFLEIDDIAALIDERTRVVEISYVSMFTGQRMELETLSKLVRSSNAILLLDVTHAAGVVPVDGQLADVMVCSCYKWLLGVHGTALFYVNPDRLPNFQPPFLGWNSPKKHGGWKDPTYFDLQETAHKFQPGNASFIGIYILENGLKHLLDIGVDNIEKHVLPLNRLLIEEVRSLRFDLMTPIEDNHRAGNVSFQTTEQENLIRSLEEQSVLIWGAYAGFGRLRISTHLYNDLNDIERCITALRLAHR